MKTVLFLVYHTSYLLFPFFSALLKYLDIPVQGWMEGVKTGIFPDSKAFAVHKVEDAV
jgi:hypothetical protein